MFRSSSRSRIDRDREDVLDSKEEEDGRAPLSLTLGNVKMVYDDGQWTPGKLQPQTSKLENDSSISSERFPENTPELDVRQMQTENRKLKEENNLLKYKLEVVIDMVIADSNSDDIL